MRTKTRRRPTHPGELLREEALPAAGLTPSELATRLGVSRRGISCESIARLILIWRIVSAVFSIQHPSSGCDSKKLLTSGTLGKLIVGNMID